jgi:hypothetical protein
MYEAWMQLHPNASIPQGFWLDEAIDFSNQDKTNEFITLLKQSKIQSPLIVTDALADMIGDLDEDKSRDINRVYRNVWRVVRAVNASFLIPHHTGWNENREKGSHAIRAKSDIVVQILKFDPDAHIMELKHNKRRGGRKLNSFSFEMTLVSLQRYPQPIPIVTGNKPTTTAEAKLLEQDLLIMILCLEMLGGSAIRARWLDQVSQFTEQRNPNRNPWSEDTFDRKRQELEAKGWITGGGARGIPYAFANTSDTQRIRAVAAVATHPHQNLKSHYPQDYPHAAL